MHPIPPNEAERLACLAKLDLPALPLPVFDHVAKVAQQHFKVPMALVSLLSEDRQIFAGEVGMNCHGTSRDTAFCSWTILSDEVFVVEDARNDPRFAANPLVTGAPFIRFYAGAPLLSPDGHRLGSACIIDTAPRSMNFAQKLVLKHIAEIATGELARFSSSQHLRPYWEGRHAHVA